MFTTGRLKWGWVRISNSDARGWHSTFDAKIISLCEKVKNVMPVPKTKQLHVSDKEAAEKYTGVSKTTQSSVLMKPWFRLKITRHFKRTDFSPPPRVDVVMLHIVRRATALISSRDHPINERFVKCGFSARRKNLKLNYKNIFNHKQWKKLSRDLEFPMHTKPS